MVSILHKPTDPGRRQLRQEISRNCHTFACYLSHVTVKLLELGGVESAGSKVRLSGFIASPDAAD